MSENTLTNFVINLLKIVVINILNHFQEYIHEKFTAEHDDEDIEVPSRSSNQQTEVINQGRTQIIPKSISKRLTPPTKTSENGPSRKIVCHCKNTFRKANIEQKK